MADPVIVLRPEPGAARTVKALRDAEFIAISYPLFTIEAMAWDAPDPADFDAILLTSANAARCAGPQLDGFRHLPLFAVGAATARAAVEAGFASVTTGGGDAAKTVPMIAAAGHGRVLHLAGEVTRPFDEGGLRITRIAVYRTVAHGDAEGLARALPREMGLFALVHSPLAAERFAALVRGEDRQRITIIAISDAASDACGSGWRGRVSAGQPTDAALLAGLQMLV